MIFADYASNVVIVNGQKGHKLVLLIRKMKLDCTIDIKVIIVMVNFDTNSCMVLNCDSTFAFNDFAMVAESESSGSQKFTFKC
jgi:hypothetical protein